MTTNGELRQARVYEGLLEGLPTIAMNRRIVEGLVADERGKFYGADPVLLAPKETPIPHHGDRPYSFGVPASLPAIVCIARLYSPEPARDRTKDMSGLGVMWFQPDFAFPIDPEVLEQLRAIDWGAARGRHGILRIATSASRRRGRSAGNNNHPRSTRRYRSALGWQTTR
jgi:hypothetical protein